MCVLLPLYERDGSVALRARDLFAALRSAVSGIMGWAPAAAPVVARLIYGTRGVRSFVCFSFEGSAAGGVFLFVVFVGGVERR